MTEFSILLPVKNGEKYIKRCLNKIMQFKSSKFEIVMLDNGSTDSTLEIAQNLKIPNLRIIQVPEYSLSESLNYGVNIARTNYIARQDVDDWSYPSRYAAQLHILSTRNNIAAVGCWSLLRNESNFVVGTLRHPVTSQGVKNKMVYGSPLVHSSVMFRRDMVLKAGNYKKVKYQLPEDYDLWLRLTKVGEIFNLPYFFHNYTKSANSVSRRDSIVLDETIKLVNDNLQKQFISRLDKKEIINISRLSVKSRTKSLAFKSIIKMGVVQGKYFNLNYQFIKFFFRVLIKNVINMVRYDKKYN